MQVLNLSKKIKKALSYLNPNEHSEYAAAALKLAVTENKIDLDSAFEIWIDWCDGSVKTWNLVDIDHEATIEVIFGFAKNLGFSDEDHEIPVIATSVDFPENSDNRSIILPENAFSPELLDMGRQAVMGISGITIPQYIYPSIMSHIMTILAGRICVNGVHPSCCFVKVGGTSTGKTQTDKTIAEIVGQKFNVMVKDKETGFDEMESLIHGPTDIASGPAIMRAVQRKERCLMIFDEITSLFSSGGRGGRDPVTASKIEAFLILMTTSGHRKEKSYSDGSKNIKLSYPVVNILGNATPEIFNEFSISDMRTGLIQRADFFCYHGNAPYWGDRKKMDNTANNFSERLFGIYSHQKPSNRYDLRLDSAIDIGMDEKAAKIMRDFSHFNIDEMNKHDDEGRKGIISRRYDAALKFSLGHCGATRINGDIYNPLTRLDIEYGIMMATLLANWKMDVLVENINLGEFDNMCKIFLGGIKSAIKANLKPTGKIIVNRRPQLKNITPRQWDDIVRALKARKEIMIDDSGKYTVYQLLKETRH